MNVDKLVMLLDPMKYICDANSLLPEYRRIVIKPGRIQARAARASLDALCDCGIGEEFAIDFNLLYPVLCSFRHAEHADITFEYTGEVLQWQSGLASGRIATAPVPSVTMLPRQPKGGIANSAGLTRMLELGSLACTNSALESIGLYGMIVLEADERAWCISSDEVTIGAACMPITPGQLLPGITTISPQDAALLSALTARPQGTIVFAENMIHYADPEIRAVVHPVSALRHDLYRLVADHMDGRLAVGLPRERVAAFAKRAAALTENQRHCRVAVKAFDREIKLEFREDRASSEEVYLLDNVSLPTKADVTVDAIKLSRALQNCDEILLDNMHKNALAFRAKDESFYYLVAGRGQ